jgi:hypothetical protein
MADLIERVKAMCNGDTTITDDDYQQLLDDHAVPIDAPLVPQAPFYTRHLAPYGNLEADTVVYLSGSTTMLSVDTDYTIDLQRGIVTTPTADYRALSLQAVAYDINAAAADGWERIAGRYALEFAFTSAGSSYSRQQQIEGAKKMAVQYRAKAWPKVSTVDRADTPPLREPDDWHQYGLYRRSDIGS